MAALLGDMVKLGGTTEMSGSIAYVSQQAWYAPMIAVLHCVLI